MIWEILLDIKSIIWIKIWILIVEFCDENNAIFEELETVESENIFVNLIIVFFGQENIENCESLNWSKQPLRKIITEKI